MNRIEKALRKKRITEIWAESLRSFLKTKSSIDVTDPLVMTCLMMSNAAFVMVWIDGWTIPVAVSGACGGLGALYLSTLKGAVREWIEPFRQFAAWTNFLVFIGCIFAITFALFGYR